MLYTIAYFSFATRRFDVHELRDLLTAARKNNGRKAVTGMLLYNEGHFMQVLEGRAPTLHLLATRIEKDPRHHELNFIFREPIQERAFPDWSMGFQDLESTEARSTPGFSDFLNTPFTTLAGDVSRSRQLLGLFKKRL
jgi:hypothetical protein